MSGNYKQVQTPEAILSFPHLFEPTSAPGSTRETFNAMLIFPKGTDLTALKELAKEVFREKFPNGAKGARDPFRNGNEKVEEWGEIFRDATYVRVSSNLRPAVVDRQKQFITEPEQVYGGQFVRAVIHAYGYDTSGNKGIAFGLDAIQIIRDGEPLGNGGSTAAVALFDNLGEGERDSGEKSEPVGGLFD